MSIDPIHVLRASQGEPRLGSIATQALRFLEDAQCRFLQSPGPGQSSLSVVRMYEIRKSLKGFHQHAFMGLDESIASLSERDVNVHLSVIETEKGLVSLWLTDQSNSPVAIIVAKFEV